MTSKSYYSLNTKPAGNSASTLIDTLHRQRDICLQLDSLSGQPAPLPETRGSDEFVDVATRRQNLVEQLSKTNNKLNLYKERWQQVTSNLASSEKQKITALFNQIHELVQHLEWK